MTQSPCGPAARAPRLRTILLHHLWVAYGGRYPGTDGLTEDDVLLSYPQVVAAGQAPGPDELCRRHPELATELESFFPRR
jgi:hypothetical protein